VIGLVRGARLGIRLVLLFALALVLYVTVTFVQVWRASTQDGVQQAGAIIVLGAAQYDGTPSPVFQARLDHAADLYDAGYARVVVVTGGGRPGDRTTEASAADRYLQSRGVRPEHLRLEVAGTNSWEQLAATRRFLLKEGIDEVLLVSDPYHSYRINAIADEVGLEAHVSPTPDSPIDGFREFRALVRETAAVSVGRIISYRRLMRVDDAFLRVRRRG
jgi:uncharacterized SAM-binding protein YcdF (DUF218 family)